MSLPIVRLWTQFPEIEAAPPSTGGSAAASAGSGSVPSVHTRCIKLAATVPTYEKQLMGLAGADYLDRSVHAIHWRVNT